MSSSQSGNYRQQMVDKLAKSVEANKRGDLSSDQLAIQEFTKYFKEQFDGATSRLVSATTEQEVEAVAGEFRSLERFVSESTSLLTARELATSTRKLEDSRVLLQEKLSVVKPRRQFQFRAKSSRNQAKADTKPVQATVAVAKGIEEDLIDESHFTGGVISNANGGVLKRGRDWSFDTDVLLKNNCNACLHIDTLCSTVHIISCTNCNIYLNPVRTSVFIDKCSNCTIYASAQQFRIHSSVDCVFYIYVASRAIIEDCSRVAFSPIAIADVGREKLEEAGIATESNNWQLVNDFNWLSSTEPSPNWSILADCDRKPFVAELPPGQAP